MSKSAIDIISDIVFYMKNLDIPFNEWYVGVTANPSQKLFAEHHVSIDADWIFRDAGDYETAKTIQDQLIERFNLKRIDDEEDHRNKYVYVFPIKRGRKK
jgi:hypothetical protein